MCLIILPISIFGAIGTPGQAFISELSRRVGGSVPPSLLLHASWVTLCVLAPASMIDPHMPCAVA